MIRTLRGGLAALALLVTFPLAAASATAPQATEPASMSTSWVRAAHLVPELGTMTVTLVPFAGSSSDEVSPGDVPDATRENGAEVLAAAAGYGTVGDYRQVPAGRYAVAIRPVDAAPGTTPVLTGVLEATGDRAYTLAALGTVDDPRVAVIDDSLERPRSGAANVRLLPAVPGASSITVKAVGGPVLAEDAPFARPTDYATVPAGRWTLDVTTTGTSLDTTPVTATVDVASAGVYTVFVLADGDDGIRLQPVVDARGAGTAPAGGVQTGGGGLAVRPVDGRVVLGAALVLGGLLVVGAARRPDAVRVEARD